jgi:hypothetical protein
VGGGGAVEEAPSARQVDRRHTQWRRPDWNSGPMIATTEALQHDPMVFRGGGPVGRRRRQPRRGSVAR